MKHCLRTVTVISYGFLSLAASDMNLHNKITHSFIIDCFSNIYLKRNLVLKLADRVIEIVTLWIVTSIVCFYSILYLIYIFGQRPWARILELILWNVFFTLSSKFQMCLVFLAITTSWIALYDLIICTSNNFVECNTFFFFQGTIALHDFKLISTKYRYRFLGHNDSKKKSVSHR